MRLLLLFMFACNPEAETPPIIDTGRDTGDPDDTGDPPVPEVPIGLFTYPAQGLTRAGERVTVRARALLDNGLTQALSSEVSWSVSQGDAATLGTGGALTGVEPGTVQVSAEYEGFRTLSHVRVLAPEVAVEALAVSPQLHQMATDQVAIFSALAALSDGTSGDLAASCIWTSSDASIALPLAGGALYAVAPGQATITADCGEDGSASALFSVVSPEDIAPPSPSLTAFSATPLEGGAVLYHLTVENQGLTSDPLVVDLYLDGAPDGFPDASLTLPGLGAGQVVSLDWAVVWTGARPATLESWATLDPREIASDADRSDNLAGPLDVSLPGDSTADLSVFFESAVAFGPNEAGVYVLVTNEGPDEIGAFSLYFEQHQEGVVAVSDLMPGDAEESVDVPSLESGATYDWVFDYTAAPYYDASWTSCGFVGDLIGYDPDLSNNFDCYTWSG